MTVLQLEHRLSVIPWLGEEVKNWQRSEGCSWVMKEGGWVCVWGVPCASIQSQGDVSSSISVVNDWCRLGLKKQPWISVKYLLEVTFARAIHSQYEISALESSWGGFFEIWFILQGDQVHLCGAREPGDHWAVSAGPLSSSWGAVSSQTSPECSHDIHTGKEPSLCSQLHPEFDHLDAMQYGPSCGHWMVVCRLIGKKWIWKGKLS